MRHGIKGGQLSIFAQEQIEEVHTTALRILEEKGVKIEEEQALQLLDENNCEVEFDSRVVKFPRNLVEEALNKAPTSIKLCGRKEEHDFILDPDHCFFTAGTGAISVLDLDTSESRKATKGDLTDAAHLSDALSNIDSTWSIFTLRDNPLLGFHQLYAILTENTKHASIVNWYGGELTEKLIDMIAVVARGKDKLAERTLVTMYGEPVSPLTFRRENIEAMFKWTEVGLPLIWYPAQKPGATSPMTLAGTLAQGLAESLGGNVIAQLNNPGTPVILGTSPLVLDMRTAMNTFFSPETLLLQAATGQWGRYVGIPTFGTGGCTNSYSLDYQAGIESALSLYGAVLGGQNLVHDLSFAGAGDLGSLALLTLTDEIIGMVKRMARGIEVNEETIALDVIESVEHGGNFLRESHTMKHAREELFAPELIKRVSQDMWEDNFSVKKASEKTKQLLAQYQADPLSPKEEAELKEIMREARDIIKT